MQTGPQYTNPWIRLKSRFVYENPWLRLREDAVIKPGGEPGTYGVVEFKNRALGVLALDDADRAVLVGQWRYAMGAYSWELPEGGGAIEKDPLAEIQRELREETGMRARVWEKFFEMDLSNSVTDEKAIVYLARDLSEGEASPEETEILSVRRVVLSEAWAMVERGEIRDALTVAALFKARVWRLEGRL